METRRTLRRWMGWTAAAAILATAVYLTAVQSPHADWFMGALWAAVVLSVIVRAVRGAGRRDPHPVRQAATPAVSGLSEVQAIAMGRVPVDELDVCPQDDVTTSLVVPYRDPLDEPVWVIRSSSQGPGRGSSEPAAPVHRL